MPSPAPIQLPYRLSFTGRREGRFPERVPGRGEAGWTVGEFASTSERDAFMARHPEAAMPCWARIIPGSTALRP